MSLENFDDLTDVELRRKLREYNFPNIPITETSRGLLIKKLKNHIKNLKSRKHATYTHVTLRSKQQLENLVTQANDWSQHNLGKTSEVSDTATLSGIERSVSVNSDTQNDDQLYLQVASTSNEHLRTQLAYQQTSTSSETSSYAYLDLIWKVFDCQRNYTNSVWWGFTLFFIIITFLYVMKTSDLSKFINEDNTNYVICDRLDPAGPLLRPPFVCIDKKRLELALTIVRNLMAKLQLRSKRHYCHNRTQPLAMSVTEFIQSMFEEGSTVDMRDVEEAEYLVVCNPQWKIDMVDQNGNPALFNGVDKMISNQNTFFVLKQLQLPLPCLLLVKAHRFVSFVGNVAFLVLVLTLMFLSYCYMRRLKEQHHRDVQTLLNIIVEELQRRAANSESPEDRDLIMNHLRNQLIPVNKRKGKLKLWSEAVRELEENDSRVRFGMTVSDGEEFRTMRWVDNATQSVTERFAGERRNLTAVETNC